MKGVFTVKFLDYFGFEHECKIRAGSSDEAIEILKNNYLYPIIEITEVYMNWSINPWFVVPISFLN